MITYKDIKDANDTIATTDIKGKEYAQVNQRIKAFRMCHPNGLIETKIISNENGVVLMQANVFDDEMRKVGTGYAQEKESSSFINKTSYIENCETSAVGRALGMCGFGIDVSIASAEEVQNAMQNQKATPKQSAITEQKSSINNVPISEGQIIYIQKNMSEERIHNMLMHYKKSKLEELSVKEASECIKILKKEKNENGIN